LGYVVLRLYAPAPRLSTGADTLKALNLQSVGFVQRGEILMNAGNISMFTWGGISPADQPARGGKEPLDEMW
jgi:hypothetical protein